MAGPNESGNQPLAVAFWYGPAGPPWGCWRLARASGRQRLFSL